MATVEISSAWIAVAGSLTVIAIGTAFLRARKFVEDRVQEALSRDEVIQSISLLVKPDMVFNQHGSVIADRGACAFIEDRGIHVTLGAQPGSMPQGIPSEIRIAFTKNLKAAPLLTSLNPETVFIRSRRGEGHDWIYDFHYSMTTDDEREFIRQYRLEIL